jgi:chitin-binding protein
MIEGCTLKWSPSAMVEGNKAFEFLELPDRNMIHPNADHLSIVPEGNIYRFDSHYQSGGPIDYDRMLFTGPMRTDRLRGEVRGMVGPGGILEMKNGQTWRIHWALNIPETLKGTGRFTHIFQLKFIDTGGGLSGSPILTLSLSQPDNLQMRLWLGGNSFPVQNIAQLHDKWLSSELVIKVGPGNTGTVRWIFKDGERMLHDSMVSGTTWPGNAVRVWPKWGIYRGITDGVRTTHMLTRDFRAYSCP